MLDTKISNGTVVSGNAEVRADVGIVDEEIVEVGDLRHTCAERTIDAEDCYILPGIIDSQVHFREPGLTHKEDLSTGSLAAICGGVTTFFEMPNTIPPTTTKTALEEKLRLARNRTFADHGFFVGASADNISELAELEQMPGTPGVKIFAGSSTGSLLLDDPRLLRKALENGNRACAIHSEDETILRKLKQQYLESTDEAQRSALDHPAVREESAAIVCTQKLVELCRETCRPIHILHISTAEEIALIRNSQSEGLPITAEVLSHHLWFESPDCYEKLGSFAQMNPPIRNVRHHTAIESAFREDFFTVFGSDHAPHTVSEKSLQYPKSPSGMPGVQTLLPAMVTWLVRAEELHPLQKIARLGCENPAKLYGIAKKGKVTPGMDADLLVLDLKMETKISKSMLMSKCGWSPYEGETLVGFPRHVFLRGKQMVTNYVFSGEPIGKPVTYDWK